MVSVLIPVHPTRELTFFVAPGIMFIDKEEIERRFAIDLNWPIKKVMFEILLKIMLSS